MAKTKWADTIITQNTRNQRKVLARDIREKYKDKQTQFKIQKELYKQSLNSPFKTINDFNFNNQFNKIKNTLIKELFGFKQQLIKIAEEKFGRQVLEAVLTGGTSLIKDASKKLISDAYKTSNIYKQLQEINEAINKLKSITDIKQLEDKQNEEKLKEYDKQHAPVNPFCNFKSSWMDTGMWDEATQTMYVKTKPNNGKIYSFSVLFVREKDWVRISEADGAGTELWDTVWRSKRTKSISAPKHSGLIKTEQGWAPGYRR